MLPCFSYIQSMVVVFSDLFNLEILSTTTTFTEKLNTAAIE